MICIVYTLALIVAYMLPSYTSNPYIFRWIPLWMLFSATFMIGWILTIPTQLFWKMHQLSVALVVSRLAQIIMLVLVVFVFFNGIQFDGSLQSIIAFLLIVWSVVVSWVAQIIYQLFIWNKILKLKISFDLKFSKDILLQNWQYWISYYLSSFHTLGVLIVLSIIYPTVQWYSYVGLWSLALALMEILLIVPSSLWNSLIHKVAWYEKAKKLLSYWALMGLICWLGGIFLVNFNIFSSSIIYFVSSSEFVGNWGVWSDTVLQFLWVVLLLSFIKQIFNYIFVSSDLQNKLLWINLTWVVIWFSVGIFAIIHYNIIGGIITQLLLELLFVLWALYIANKHKVFPTLNYQILAYFTLMFIWLYYLFDYVLTYPYTNIYYFVWEAILLNVSILALSYFPLKKILRNLQ